MVTSAQAHGWPGTPRGPDFFTTTNRELVSVRTQPTRKNSAPVNERYHKRCQPKQRGFRALWRSAETATRATRRRRS